MRGKKVQKGEEKGIGDHRLVEAKHTPQTIHKPRSTTTGGIEAGEGILGKERQK